MKYVNIVLSVIVIQIICICYLFYFDPDPTITIPTYIIGILAGFVVGISIGMRIIEE